MFLTIKSLTAQHQARSRRLELIFRNLEALNSDFRVIDAKIEEINLNLINIMKRCVSNIKIKNNAYLNCFPKDLEIIGLLENLVDNFEIDKNISYLILDALDNSLISNKKVLNNIY